ncbi:MAG: hypothetical protein J6P72_03640 [Firmicutes bacterium]|nr:hypothetical protein [Bacillota bacterium]
MFYYVYLNKEFTVLSSELILSNPIGPKIDSSITGLMLRDLDMHGIFTLIDPRMDEDAAASFAERYFSSDPDEISSRCAMIRSLSTLTGSAEFQEGIDALKALSQENQKAKTASGRLAEVLYPWRRAAAYYRAINLWCRILSGSPESSGNSQRLLAFRLYINSLQNAPSFAQLSEALNQLDELLPLPHYIHVGFNMREDGYPQEMGILSVSGHIDLRDEEHSEELPLNALLSFDDPTRPSLSIGPEFNYNRGLYGSHFDEYIARCLEKEWKGDLSKAAKILENMPALTELENLISLIEPLQFYQIALLFQEAFTGRGYTLTDPKPSADGSLIIKDALYPDFILRDEGIKGNDIQLTRGNALMITGANHSGKTSYLKTIGQILVLAQLGLGVPASSMEFSPFHQIYTLFSAGEDSSMTASRMGVEVKKLSAILKQAGENDLILLNEPMTSTNPVEAVSICADMTRHFLEKGITHLMVTHLYDIYFLLKSELPKDLFARLHSLVTESAYDSSTGSMLHAYHLYEHEPLGNSYGRETAISYGITLENMISVPESLVQARDYMKSQRIDQVYEGGGEVGLSDQPESK